MSDGRDDDSEEVRNQIAALAVDMHMRADALYDEARKLTESAGKLELLVDIATDDYIFAIRDRLVKEEIMIICDETPKPATEDLN